MVECHEPRGGLRAMAVGYHEPCNGVHRYGLVYFIQGDTMRRFSKMFLHGEMNILNFERFSAQKHFVVILQ